MVEVNEEPNFISIGKYKAIPARRGGFLGQGAFGKVLKGIDPETKQVIALKLIPKTKILRSSYSEKLFQREVEIQKKIKGRNIVHFIDLIEYKDYFVLVTEYCNDGDLAKKIETNTHGLSENLIIRYLKDFLAGYKILYDNKIIHRDIKPGNLLIHDGILKIADFGLAKHYGSDASLGMTLGIGSPIYMAPEVLLKKPYNNLSDVWSLGVTLHEARFGDSPWTEAQNLTELRKIIRNLTSQPYKFPGKSNSKLKTLLESMIKFDPKQRITWEELFNHPIIQEDLMEFSLNFSLPKPKNTLDKKMKSEYILIELEKKNSPKNETEEQILINKNIENKISKPKMISDKKEDWPEEFISFAIESENKDMETQNKRITDDELREFVKLEEQKTIFKENQQIIRDYLKIAQYILYAKEKCQKIFKINCSKSPEDFFSELRLLDLTGIFLKIGIFILQIVDELQFRNTLDLELWESFVKSVQYESEKGIVSNIYKTFKRLFEDFLEELTPELKKQIEPCILSNDLRESQEFSSFSKTFKKDFIILSYALSKHIGKKVKRDFLIVVEITLNIVDWKQVFQPAKGRSLDIEKFLEVIEFENNLEYLPLIQTRVETQYKIATSRK